MKVTLIDGDSLFYGICFGKYDQFKKRIKSFKDITEYYSHLDSWVHNILQETKATHYLAFYTKGSVFRHKIDPLYKSGRPEDKPLFFYDVRKHFRDTWKGIAVDLLEAEDLVSVYANHYRENNIDYTIAYIDHDLGQIYGTHFNFKAGLKKKEAFKHVSIEQSFYNLYHQILTGCTTDCVKGLKGIGKGKATTLLDVSFGNGTTDYINNLHNKVLETYIKKEGLEIGLERFNEVYSLIALLVTTKDIKKYTGIDYMLQDPIFYENQSHNMFKNVNFSTQVNVDDLPDFLK